MQTSIRKIAGIVASVELWAVAGIVAAAFVSARLLLVGVIVALVFWPVRWLAYRRFSVRTPLDAPVLVVAVMAAATLWVSAWPDETRLQVFRLLSGIGLCYAVINWPASGSNPVRRVRLVTNGMALAALGLAVFALVSVQWGSLSKLPFIPQAVYSLVPTLVSDTANPNVMAGSLVVLFPLVLSWLLFGWRSLGWIERIIAAVGLLVLAPMLVLTQSRGALMAVGAVLLIFPLLRWRRGWLATLAALLAAVGVAFWQGVTPLVNLLVSNATLGGLDGRLEVWSRAIYMIQDFPFTGVGMGSYGRVADLLYPFFLYAPGKVEHAHNLLLQVAVDLGIPGLVGWLACWLIVTLAGWQVYRSGQRISNGLLTGLGAGVLCSQFALLVHGMVDAVTWGMVRPAPLIWALWGLAIATWMIVEKSANHSKSDLGAANRVVQA